MSTQKTISVNDISLCNDNSFVLIGGLNVLETKDLNLKVAETFKEITSRLKTVSYTHLTLPTILLV